MSAFNRPKLTPNLESIRDAASKAIGAIRPAPDYYFHGQRTDAGRDLPPYYLVYFLLVDLLGFLNFGREEKVAWSVPITLDRDVFIIEHRKFGIGVFAQGAQQQEQSAREVVRLINKGVKTAEPFFEWLAEQAVISSQLNVINKSRLLFERYRFFLETYREAEADAVSRKDEREIKTREAAGGTVTTVHMPRWQLEEHAEWLAQAAIRSLF